MDNEEKKSNIDIEKLLKPEKNLNKKEQLKANEDLLNSLSNDDMKVVVALLMEIKDKNERELKYTRTQMRTAMFTSILSLVIVIALAIGIISFVPKVNVIIGQVNTVVEEANNLISQSNKILSNVEPTIDNLNAVSKDLANADLTGMIQDVDSLVTTSEESMGEALKTITDIDIDSLNQAITDLSSIVAPLAKMFRR